MENLSKGAEGTRSARQTGLPLGRPLRVLVLHQHYWPEIAATAQILSDICEDLAAAGHEVTVICGQPSYRLVEGKGRLPRHEMHRGVSVQRVWSYTPGERTIPKRLVHYASYFGTSLGSAIAGQKPDVCLVMSTPPLLLGISGLLLRALREVPFVYCVQDLYPDVAVHLGVIREHGLAARAINTAATICYRSAASLITISSGMARSLSTKGVPTDRIHVIPNWADTSAVKPTCRDNPFAREHNLANGFVVQYSGNLGMSQGLECLIGAAELLKDLPITWAFVGDGNARVSLERLVQAKSLRRVQFLPPQPRERLTDLLGSCDVGLVPMKRGVSKDLVPSKLYGIMAAARPVLASVEASSEVARVLSTHDCGWIVTPELPEAIASAVKSAFETPESVRRRLGENGRIACSEHYSRGVLTRAYGAALAAAAQPSR